MINFIKVQQDCIKALAKGNKVIYCEYDKCIWVSIDGYVAYAFPVSDFYVDISKMKPINLTYIFGNRSLSISAKKTDTIKSIGKYNAVKFECGEETHWMQEKFSKLCDKWTSYGEYFYGYDKNNFPVVIVMEVKVK